MLPEVKKILYASDLGEHTRPVSRMAVSLAQKYGAKIVMVHALEPMGNFGHALIDAYVPKETVEAMQQEGLAKVIKNMRQRLETFAKEELNMTPEEFDLVSDLVVEEGTPTEVVLDAAKEYGADMIVLGSHGHSNLHHLLIGSTARHVTQHAEVPVLVVPTQDKP